MKTWGSGGLRGGVAGNGSSESQAWARGMRARAAGSGRGGGMSAVQEARRTGAVFGSGGDVVAGGHCAVLPGMLREGKNPLRRVNLLRRGVAPAGLGVVVGVADDTDLVVPEGAAALAGGPRRLPFSSLGVVAVQIRFLVAGGGSSWW